MKYLLYTSGFRSAISLEKSSTGNYCILPILSTLSTAVEVPMLKAAIPAFSYGHFYSLGNATPSTPHKNKIKRKKEKITTKTKPNQSTKQCVFTAVHRKY